MKQLKTDWVMATKKERVKFISVFTFSLVIAVTCACLLIIGIENGNMPFVLLSYGLFMVVGLLSHVNLKPAKSK